MKIGILADTHDHVHHIKKAVDLFRLQGIKTVLHAGDFCSPFTVPEFKGFRLHAVFGNNDGDHFRLLSKMKEIGGEHHAEFASLTVEGRKIGVYHGTQPEISKALVKSGMFDLVVTGHTHEAFVSKEGETLWVNPGSAHGFDARPTVCLYDTEKQEARITEL